MKHKIFSICESVFGIGAILLSHFCYDGFGKRPGGNETIILFFILLLVILSSVFFFLTNQEAQKTGKQKIQIIQLVFLYLVVGIRIVGSLFAESAFYPEVQIVITVVQMIYVIGASRSIYQSVKDTE